MQRTFKSFVFVVAGWVCLFFLGCSSPPKEQLEKSALELNRLCPTMIDSYTRIDSARYIADENCFQYYYALCDEKDDPNIAQQEKKELLQRITESIKHEPNMAAFRRYRIAMEYIYSSQSNGNEFFRIKVTPDMY